MKIKALCKIQYIDGKGSRLVALYGDELNVDTDIAKKLISNGSASPLEASSSTKKASSSTKKADS